MLLRSSKNSSIEIFFGRPSALVKRSSCAGLLPTGRKNQRLSKSLLLYTICLILKTSPARLCRLFELASLKKGIIFPFHAQYVKIDSLPKKQTHWSRAFITWLMNDVRLMSDTRASLDLLIRQVEVLRGTLLEATRQLRMMSQTERYKHRHDLLRTIPGIGIIVTMCILTEVCDVKRFHNENEFAAYLGLIPTSHNSGEKIVHGEKTFRGNKQLGPMIVEAAWITIGRDAGLGAQYFQYKQRMEPQEAIVRNYNLKLFIIPWIFRTYRHRKRCQFVRVEYCIAFAITKKNNTNKLAIL